MTFSVNNSPFAGREGEYVTSRHLRARLFKELQTDVSPARERDRQHQTPSRCRGRGELHLSILIENMRRQGYEFQVSKPQVLYKEIDGKKLRAHRTHGRLTCRRIYAGAVIEKIGRRRGTLESMHGREPRASGVPDSLPRPVRLPQRVHDRYPRRGHHELRVRKATSPSRAIFRTALSARWSALRTARPPATACSTRRSAARCSSGRRRPVYKGMICGQNARPDDTGGQRLQAEARHQHAQRVRQLRKACV